MADLVKFLKQQPGNALRGTKLDDFYRAHPSYKGTGIKLKVLAGKHPSRLRWVPGANEGLHKIMLVGASAALPSPASTASAAMSALVPVPTGQGVLAARIQQLVDANPHGNGSWTATKLDKAYREQFGAEEGWWTALGVTAATDAFRKFPGIIVARRKLGKGIHFVKTPHHEEQPELRAQSKASAGAPSDTIAKNLRKVIPVAPGGVEIGTLGSQFSGTLGAKNRYMLKVKVALTQARGGAPTGTVPSAKPVGMDGRQSGVASCSGAAPPGVAAPPPDNSDAPKKCVHEHRLAALAADLVCHLEALQGSRMNCSTDVVPFMKRFPQHKGVKLKAAVTASPRLEWIPMKRNAMSGFTCEAVGLRPKAVARSRRGSSALARPSGGTAVGPDPPAATAVTKDIRDGESGVVLGQRPSAAGMARPTLDPNAPPDSTFPAHRFVDAQVTAIYHGNRYFVVDRWVYCSFDILAGASKPPRVGETMTVRAFHWPTPTACQWRACAYEAPADKAQVPDPAPYVRRAVHPGSCVA